MDGSTPPAVHRDRDLYQADLRPRWRRRWRWLALAIVDGRERRLQGWCWTRHGARRRLGRAEHALDLWV